jgi:hypothetical protein
MAVSYQVLAQNAPASNTNTDILTTTTQVVCSTLVVCNRSTSTTYNIAVRVGGATLANSQYIVYNGLINTNDTVFLTLGMTLAVGDVVTVNSGNGSLSFSMFGSQVV